MFSTCLLLTAAVALGETKPTDWPQWRGPNRDGVSAETGLLKEWPEGGPTKVWTIKGIGGGYSTPAVVGGKIYGMGKTDGQETLWALNEADGSSAWKTVLGAARKVGYDEGPRSTPTFADGKLYAVTMGGDLHCLDAKTGSKVWKKSYVDEFGGQVHNWGYSESVLVDGDVVIGTPCSNQAAVVAFKAATGEVIWKATVADAGKAGGYSSPVKAKIAGVTQYVVMLGKAGGIVGVEAKTGKLLWQYTRVNNGIANIPTVIVKGDLVFCSTGYGDGGSALLKIAPDGDAQKAEEIKYYSAKELQNHHGGMVLLGEHLYMGRGHNNGLPTCVEFGTASIVWKEDAGAGRGTGTGSLSAADGMLYFHYANGVVALVKATSSGYELAGRFDVPEKSGKPSWPHPVIANGRLYIRDQNNLHAFDIKAK